jgi:gas vesicle protein
MDATAWTVVGAAIAVLIAMATAFRSLRSEIRLFREHVDNRIDAQGQGLRERIDTQGQGLRERIDTQGQGLRERIDTQGQELRERIDAQGQELREQSSQLRERMAKLEGLLEGLREAITGKRAA